MTFTLGNKQYPVEIIFQEAYGPLKKDFKLNIFNMFSENDNTPRQLLLDDEYVLDLMWYFVKKEQHIQTKENMIAKITSMDVVDEFREELWAGVVNFSSHLKRPMLMEAWKVMKKEIKGMKMETGNDTSGVLDSTFDQEE